MRKWIFAGNSDKRDLLLYIGKILTAADQRVLLADFTEANKYKYWTGSEHVESPVVEFAGFDIMNGFAGMNNTDITYYDCVLYDVESTIRGLADWSEIDQIVWVTTCDRYEVESSAGSLSELLISNPHLEQIEILPVFVRVVDSYITISYVLSLVDQLELRFSQDRLQIPWNEVDLATQLENEHRQSVQLSRLSRTYKRSIRSLVGKLTGWESNEVKRAFRIAERR